jgi:hypothetical protein
MGRGKKTMIKAEFMTVTPAMAKEWLKKNVSNRALSQKTVNKYAEDIKNNRWTLNGETIQFNVKGELKNGQHRLNGIVLANIPVQILVVTGIEDERAFETIDQGLARGAHTVMQLRGIPNAKRMQSLAKNLLAWDKTEDKGSFALTGKTFSNMEIVNYFDEHRDEIEFVYELFQDAQILRTCKAYSAVFVALILCFRADPDKTYTFMEKFKTGANLTENSPILLLRNKLTHVTVKDGGRRWALEVMALIIKAFNSYAAGKTQRQLRWNNEVEKFPIPLKKVRFLKEVQQQWKMS